MTPGRPAPPPPDTIPATPSSGEGTTADTAQRPHIAVGLRTLPRQYWLLIAGTFVYATGVEMCYPFQTLYLNQRLGLSMTSVGVIIGITLFAGLPFQIVGGAIADRFGRRPVLILAICADMAHYSAAGRWTRSAAAAPSRWSRPPVFWAPCSPRCCAPIRERETKMKTGLRRGPR